jgi:hypothetical protein
MVAPSHGGVVHSVLSEAILYSLIDYLRVDVDLDSTKEGFATAWRILMHKNLERQEIQGTLGTPAFCGP